MSTTPPAPLRMIQMLSAYWTSQCLIVAAKLRLADHVHGGPKTAEELAKLTGTHAPSLYRMLRGLASNGVFAMYFRLINTLGSKPQALHSRAGVRRPARRLLTHPRQA